MDSQVGEGNLIKAPFEATRIAQRQADPGNNAGQFGISKSHGSFKYLARIPSFNFTLAIRKIREMGAFIFRVLSSAPFVVWEYMRKVDPEGIEAAGRKKGTCRGSVGQIYDYDF